MVRKTEQANEFITFEQMVDLGMMPSLDSLKAQLQEVYIEEERLKKLKNDHPELAKLPNDHDLNATDYKIWQSIRMLKGVLKRKKDLEEAIAIRERGY